MKSLSALAALSAALAVGASAHAAVNLVTNGGFEDGGNGLAFIQGTYDGVPTYNAAATSQIVGWTAYGAGTFSDGSGGVTDTYNGYSVSSSNPTATVDGGKLTCATVSTSCMNTDPSASVTNTLQPSAIQTDPNGGYFVTLDGDPKNSTGLYQTITGLKAGNTYDLSFDYAAVDRQENQGAYTNNVLVSFCAGAGVTSGAGCTSHATATLSEPSQGFSGWLKGAFQFTATSGTETLSFLSKGTPAGAPPSLALDGVDLAVPEPTTWVMMLLGVSGIGGIARLRRRRQSALIAS